MIDEYKHRNACYILKGNDFNLYKKVINMAEETCYQSSVNVVMSNHHLFPEFQGFTGCTVSIILAESHFYIHTYPEFGYATVSCQTCSSNIDPRDLIKLFAKKMKAKILKENFIEIDQNI